MKILIVQARFYDDISDMLLLGAITELKNQGVEYDIIDVKGALEIPYTISVTSKKQKYDGFIALGCVIRGETSHYDIVTMQSAYGIMKLTVEKDLAITNGIITVENQQQAFERADIAKKNKGGFVVQACIDMIKLKKNLR